jgi:hypothetical protein
MGGGRRISKFNKPAQGNLTIPGVASALAERTLRAMGILFQDFTHLPVPVQIVIGLAGYTALLYWARALKLARHGAGRFLKDLLYVVLALYLLGCALWLFMHAQRNSPWYPVMIVGAFAFLWGVAAYLRRRPGPRKRAIPASVRKAVIARDLGDTPFDSSKHHIDHIWPYSKGGSHTVDNLRVVARKENLRKGAKRPRLREMW